VEQRLLPLRGMPEEEISARIKSYWRELDAQGRFLLIKLVGGGFRVGVSKLLVQRALAAHAGVDAKRVAQRMMGYTDGKSAPSAARYLALMAQGDAASDMQDEGQPYPVLPGTSARWHAGDLSRRAWALSPTGRSNGNMTVSAARWCGAAAGPGCGRVVRNW
jgi:hypothetical protein